VIQTESFTDRESSIKAAVGCFFQTDSRAIKDIIMRKKLLTQLLWLTSLLVVKDLPYQRVKDVPLPQQDVSPLVGCYHPQPGAF